jgi:hypothetical protein
MTTGSKRKGNPDLACKYFIGQLLNVVNTTGNETEYDAIFLRQSKTVPGQFHFPQVEDKSVITSQQIKTVLQEPQKDRRGTAFFFGNQLHNLGYTVQ